MTDLKSLAAVFKEVEVGLERSEEEKKFAFAVYKPVRRRFKPRAQRASKVKYLMKDGKLCQ